MNKPIYKFRIPWKRLSPQTKKELKRLRQEYFANYNRQWMRMWRKNNKGGAESKSSLTKRAAIADLAPVIQQQKVG